MELIYLIQKLTCTRNTTAMTQLNNDQILILCLCLSPSSQFQFIIYENLTTVYNFHGTITSYKQFKNCKFLGNFQKDS